MHSLVTRNCTATVLTPRSATRLSIVLFVFVSPNVTLINLSLPAALKHSLHLTCDMFQFLPVSGILEIRVPISLMTVRLLSLLGVASLSMSTTHWVCTVAACVFLLRAMSHHHLRSSHVVELIAALNVGIPGRLVHFLIDELLIQFRHCVLQFVRNNDSLQKKTRKQPYAIHHAALVHFRYITTFSEIHDRFTHGRKKQHSINRTRPPWSPGENALVRLRLFVVSYLLCLTQFSLRSSPYVCLTVVRLCNPPQRLKNGSVRSLGIHNSRMNVA